MKTIIQNPVGQLSMCSSKEPSWIWIAGLLILMAWISQEVQAQHQLYPENKVSSLEVGFNHTVFLVFDSPILSADRGSKHLLAQKDQAASNILKVKAAHMQMPITNLHVVTQAGKVYSFDVVFNEQPQSTTYFFSGNPLSLPFSHNQRSFLENAQQLKRLPVKKMITHQTNHDVQLGLAGIYEIDGMLYLKVICSSQSAISYHPGEVQFLIKDKIEAKKTTRREEALHPVYRDQPLNILPKEAFHTWIFAFEKFGLDSSKILEMTLEELRGDRQLILKIKGKHLHTAINLSHVQLNQ